MFSRLKLNLPNVSGDWNEDGPRLFKALQEYVRGLEGKDVLRIGQAQIFADQGMQFPATQVASSDANNLDDYKEGTWTPADGSGAALVLTVNAAKYTKIGRAVFVYFDVTYPATASGATAQISGFPYTEANKAIGAVLSSAGSPTVCNLVGTTAGFFTAAGVGLTNANLSGATFRSSIVLMV